VGDVNRTPSYAARWQRNEELEGRLSGAFNDYREAKLPWVVVG